MGITQQPPSLNCIICNKVPTLFLNSFYIFTHQINFIFKPKKKVKRYPKRIACPSSFINQLISYSFFLAQTKKEKMGTNFSSYWEQIFYPNGFDWCMCRRIFLFWSHNKEEKVRIIFFLSNILQEKVFSFAKMFFFDDHKQK